MPLAMMSPRMGRSPTALGAGLYYRSWPTGSPITLGQSVFTYS